MLKKTTLAVLGLALNGVAMAGMYSEAPAPSCTPGDVTVPCEAQAWELGVQALYLKPIYSKVYGYAYNSTATSYREIDPKWGWGFRLDGAYHYGTGSDISLNWSHYDVDDNVGSAFPGTYQLSYLLPPTNALYSLSLTNQYDQVNAVVGQHVDMGILKNARFYGGLQYAKIYVNQTKSYAVSALVLAATRGVGSVTNADFNGFGPTVGIDYSYDLAQNFSLTANTAASLVYGSSRYQSSTVLGSNVVPYTVYASRKAVIPSFEAKLGANYAYQMAQGTLNIEGGYQAVNYFNALQTPSVINTGLTTSDFGLYGPYFGVKWLGNA
ncbi:Lpg1974 family pore-forming outer membrane protein [Legionella dresdenensis]|uniref:Lpg1974 family pore-forming outer membrane protein n=1 Tax=Legionella dresdenensis TaxID=450200 RepID=A0ABV8CHT5_9GAMM